MPGFDKQSVKTPAPRALTLEHTAPGTQIERHGSAFPGKGERLRGVGRIVWVIFSRKRGTLFLLSGRCAVESVLQTRCAPPQAERRRLLKKASLFIPARKNETFDSRTYKSFITYGVRRSPGGDRKAPWSRPQARNPCVCKHAMHNLQKL